MQSEPLNDADSCVVIVTIASEETSTCGCGSQICAVRREAAVSSDTAFVEASVLGFDAYRAIRKLPKFRRRWRYVSACGFLRLLGLQNPCPAPCCPCMLPRCVLPLLAPCFLDSAPAPSEAALLPFSNENGNCQLQDRSEYHIFIHEENFVLLFIDRSHFTTAIKTPS